MTKEKKELQKKKKALENFICMQDCYTRYECKIDNGDAFSVLNKDSSKNELKLVIYHVWNKKEIKKARATTDLLLQIEKDIWIERIQ